MPILSALMGYAGLTHAPFYTPGHKLGRGIHPSLLHHWGSDIFRFDLPELPDLDNLFAPTGAIAKSQALAAETFGADETFFLVNGSTVGIMAAIVAVTQAGRSNPILMPRTIHRSAIAGCIVAGAEPVFLTPPYDPTWDLPLCLTPEQVQAGLLQYPETVAVLLVSPTYQGVVADVRAIATLCHNHDIPLIVDAAHGPHFGFHPTLPPSPLACGADVVIQSTHKVLSALTQASMLHRQGQRIQGHRIQRALQLLQTSSPSYLLLASLDAVRSQIATQGEALMAQTLELASQTRRAITTIPGIQVLAPDDESPQNLDLTRLTLDVSDLGLSGFDADEYLQQHHVLAELPLLKTLTLIVSLGNQTRDIEQLIQGLKALASDSPNLQNSDLAFLQQQSQAWYASYPAITRTQVTVREAFFAASITCSIQDAVGQLSAELICPYPPGIPALMPGEQISAPTIAYLQNVQSAGGILTGCRDSSLETLQVLTSI